jgi:hypothetical protein
VEQHVSVVDVSPNLGDLTMPEEMYRGYELVISSATEVENENVESATISGFPTLMPNDANEVIRYTSWAIRDVYQGTVIVDLWGIASHLVGTVEGGRLTDDGG